MGGFILAFLLFGLVSLWQGSQTVQKDLWGYRASIDLTRQRWYALEGFSEAGLGQIGAGTAGVKIINHFPIALNQVFRVPAGNGTREYTLMTVVSLTEEDLSAPLMLSLAEVGENWALYLNGHEIRQEIYLGAQGQILLRRSLQRVLIPLPYPDLKPGDNQIVFRLIGSSPPNAILHGVMPGFPMETGYEIGPAVAMIRQRAVQDAVTWLQDGVFVFFGFFQLLLYYRRKEAYALFFGLFLLVFGAYSFFNSTLVFDLIQNTEIISRILFAAAIISPGLVGISFIDYLYGGRPWPIGLRWVVIPGLPVLLLAFFLPFPWAEGVIRLYLPFLLVSVIYLAWIPIRAYRQHIRDASKFLLAGIVILPILVFNVFDVIIFRTGLDLVVWAPFLLALSFAAIFVDRVWRMSTELAEANRQLAQNQDRLEQQVSERTAALLGVKTELEFQLDEINDLQSSLKEQAMRDPLTGLYNRRLLVETLEVEFGRAAREGQTVCLVLMDIDHFKRVNDQFGHRSGDRVLVAFSNMLLANTRRGDFPCRYGGEEFLIVLPDTHLSAALRRAEAWRANLAGINILAGEAEICVTASVGVAEYPTHGTTPDEVLGQADAALYKAKRDGRNRVQVAGEYD